jgi:hypothetical protein
MAVQCPVHMPRHGYDEASHGNERSQARANMNHEPDALEVDMAFGKPFPKSAISTETLLIFQQTTNWRHLTCATPGRASIQATSCSRQMHKIKSENGTRAAESPAGPHRVGHELEPTGGDGLEDESSLFGLLVAVRTGWDRILVRPQRWATPCPLCPRSMSSPYCRSTELGMSWTPLAVTD